jgi:hypothetical protein
MGTDDKKKTGAGVAPLIGERLSALSNFDIEDYYKGNPKFGGCPCNDELSSVHDPKKFYIINMAKREDGGSHWTLLFEDLYFDSFGCPPTLEVEPFASVWNDTAYQDFHSSACGFYCIYVADNLMASRDPTFGLIPDDEETGKQSSELVLQRYFQQTKGAGLFSRIKESIRDRFIPRKAESARLRKFLDGEGNQAVTKMEVARKPVYSVITKLLNAASGGRLEKKRKELGYDDLYHNYLLVTLKNGKVYRVENNHQVEAKEATSGDFKGERSNVPVTSDKSLNEMITNAATNDPKFWRYDARNSNCQDFTRKVLTKNGLTPEHDPGKGPFPFPQQDAKALTDTLPTKGVVAKAITDVAQYADQVIHGGRVDTSKW